MMSDKDLIPLNNVQLPAYLQGFQSSLNDNLVTQRESFPRISLRGRQFRFKKDGEETSLSMGMPLNIVILLADPAKGCGKSYYIEAYQSDSGDPPDCSAANGQIPDNWVDDPQSSSCATCPHSEWGSATDQNGTPTKGKACSDVKRLFVVPPNDPGSADIFLLQIPPASLKALSNYGRQLAKHGIPVEGVITKVQFVDSEFPQVEFTFGGFLDEALAKASMERSKSDEIQSILTDSGALAPEQQAPPPEPDLGISEKDDIPDFSGATGAKEQAAIDAKAWEDDSFSGAAVTDPTGANGTSTQTQQGTVAAELDAEGQPWNPDLHATPAGKTAKNVWRKRRGAGKVAAQKVPVQQQQTTQQVQTEDPAPQNAAGGFYQEPETEVPDDSDIQNLLSDWGG